MAIVVSGGGPAQGQVKMRLTARVDTTQPDVQAVYALLGHYFNARPDSAYANPFWNAAEVAYHVGEHHEKVDLGALFMFNGLSAKQFFAIYQPTVLSIEPAGAKYVARVLLYADGPPAWVAADHWNPPFQLRYYAVRNAAGQWQLENTWPNEVGTWNELVTPWIRFHYPPTAKPDAAKARRASAFCDSVVTLLHLAAARPFDYYVVNSEEQLGRLFNYDYWLPFLNGVTQKAYNRTFSARGREQHLHEFVHVLYPEVKNYFLAEGLATYLGGVDGYTPYRQTLRAVAADLARHRPAVPFKDLYDGTFRYPTNGNPRYVAGALVYELVAQKAGVASFQKLEQSENTYASFLTHFAALMQMRAPQAEALLQKRLAAYAK
ncbi:hypothetical protein BEN49_20270 [Hymenobacter coccineus]|uniref:Uncharacterized protein n=1 Tax=Hymenobacter coccineus TaxID=1908235 RepID=A0A1G1TKB6_9BACT|nr:hypothetical protein BEN49_20270 [Hymenobacter coccineus]